MNALARTTTTMIHMNRGRTACAARTFAHEAVGGGTVMRPPVIGRTIQRTRHHEATGLRTHAMRMETVLGLPPETPIRSMTMAKYHHEAVGRTAINHAVILSTELTTTFTCHHEATGRTARLKQIPVS